MKEKNRLSRYIIIVILTLTVPVSVYLINQKTSFFNRAYTTIFGTRARLVVNLTDSYSLEEFPWSSLAQGGEEKGGMLDAVIAKVSALEPDYIRIDHVFDFYDLVVRGDNNQLFYSWEKLDKEINSITSTGAKPFLSLSYMPEALSRGNEVDIPVSWEEYGQLVKATVEHISGRSQLGISDVYYEVWNEPDLFGEFRTYGAKNYLTLYLYAERGAVQAENVLPFKIGGPATTTLDERWFDDFFNFAVRNDLRVDFYSWHRYSKDVRDYEKDIENARAWIIAFPEHSEVEFIISESGYETENDEGYDGTFSAIHTLAIQATTFQKISKTFVFEIKDGPGDKKYWGRWGLLTHEKFGEPEAKPRYNAILFLNQMKGNWHPVYGQGSWVKAFSTSDEKGVIRLLLVNYDPFGRHSENVPINFSSLPYSEFTFKRRDFLGGTSEFEVTAEDNGWSTSQLMRPNSASIFEITPK